jgi:hypothetical protein
MKVCPYRVDFYKKLGSDKATVDKQMHSWLDAPEGIVIQMKTEYVTKNYGQI